MCHFQIQVCRCGHMLPNTYKLMRICARVRFRSNNALSFLGNGRCENTYDRVQSTDACPRCPNYPVPTPQLPSEGAGERPETMFRIKKVKVRELVGFGTKSRVEEKKLIKGAEEEDNEEEDEEENLTTVDADGDTTMGDMFTENEDAELAGENSHGAGTDEHDAEMNAYMKRVDEQMKKAYEEEEKAREEEEKAQEAEEAEKEIWVYDRKVWDAANKRYGYEKFRRS